MIYATSVEKMAHLTMVDRLQYHLLHLSRVCRHILPTHVVVEFGDGMTNITLMPNGALDADIEIVYVYGKLVLLKLTFPLIILNGFATVAIDIDHYYSNWCRWGQSLHSDWCPCFTECNRILWSLWQPFRSTLETGW